MSVSKMIRCGQGCSGEKSRQESICSVQKEQEETQAASGSNTSSTGVGLVFKNVKPTKREIHKDIDLKRIKPHITTRARARVLRLSASNYGTA